MAFASAPGKLFISGEYAVLDGGIALVTAVAVRAKARVTRLAEEYSTFEHPVTGQLFHFTASRASGLRWASQHPDVWGMILAAIMSTWQENGSTDDVLPALSVSIDTNEFFTFARGARRKLGLGSSAAATVALARAFAAALGERQSVQELEVFCRAAHARVQHGLGSGVDVLTAIHGGVIAGRRDDSPCKQLPWPPGLFMVPVWSGAEACSVELVRRLQSYRAKRRKDYARHIATLRQTSATVQTVWQTQNAHQILSALSAYDSALADLDDDASIGIYTRVHEQLREIAERLGAIYKVSGAGGGDIGLAIARSEPVASEVRRGFAAAGFEALDLTMAEPGVRDERV